MKTERILQFLKDQFTLHRNFHNEIGEIEVGKIYSEVVYAIEKAEIAVINAQHRAVPEDEKEANPRSHVH